MNEELSETCTLHGCELAEGVVPVFYGFIVTSPEYGRAWRALFRYSRCWAPGGCSMAAGRPSAASVQYCPSCRAAESTWLMARIRDRGEASSWEWFLTGVLGLRGKDDGPAALDMAGEA
jgi:hypothetical protein